MSPGAIRVIRVIAVLAVRGPATPRLRHPRFLEIRKDPSCRRRRTGTEDVARLQPPATLANELHRWPTHEHLSMKPLSPRERRHIAVLVHRLLAVARVQLL